MKYIETKLDKKERKIYRDKINKLQSGIYILWIGVIFLCAMLILMAITK